MARKKVTRLKQGAGSPDADTTGGWRLNASVIAGKRGWAGPGGGRSALIDSGAVYQSTTRQTAGLYPFILGAGLPPEGVPIGPDLLTHELVCLDPSGWIGSLVSNPGVWIQAQPGVGKSAISKRITLVYSAYGYMLLVPGDVKGEYAPLVRALGGQVVRVGRGLSKINPLGSGPLRGRLAGLPEEQRTTLLAELNARRAELLHALLSTSVALGRRPTATEASVVGEVIRLVSERLDGDPIIPDIVRVLREGPTNLWDRLMVDTEESYRGMVREVVAGLENLVSGSGPLAGLFDGPTTTPIDIDAPALSVDLSALLTAGDSVVSAGLLATWAYSYSAIDSARALGQMDRPLVLPMDEMWRALRAGPGMVSAFDSMTRLNRAKNEVTLFITHSVRDPESLPTEEDRAKALGMMDRCDTLILGALSVGELDRVSEQRPLTAAEKGLVASWSAARVSAIDQTPGSGTGVKRKNTHPGRGKYLIKLGNQAGTAAKLVLTDTEAELYETDPRQSGPGEA